MCLIYVEFLYAIYAIGPYTVFCYANGVEIGTFNWTLL